MAFLKRLFTTTEPVKTINPLEGKQNAINTAKGEKLYQQTIEQAKKNSNIANAIAREVHNRNSGSNYNRNSGSNYNTTPLGSSLKPPPPSTNLSILKNSSIPPRKGPLILPLSVFRGKLKQTGQRNLLKGSGKRKTISRRQRRRSTRKQVRNRQS